ncbi:hypothetical protein I8752_34450 [Nostocaceae cyanobacterium CENA369]|uniref:Uncharacterized protein n=1 Tax=Dendronalium phyllosphericum CENA369 TaxID=1725256 RepID=A0A8J7LI98_9NOST|nr:hypothetical protein [Dendronalium phyllosphericum]MBH8577976.1 hypothetical protein [Dendronalium phyllosphericum CENA369]
MSLYTHSDWQQMEQWLEEPRRYSAAQLQKKWQQACGVNVGKEQVRRLVKKRVHMETDALQPTTSPKGVCKCQTARLGIVKVVVKSRNTAVGLP